MSREDYRGQTSAVSHAVSSSLTFVHILIISKEMDYTSRGLHLSAKTKELDKIGHLIKIGKHFLV